MKQFVFVFTKKIKQEFKLIFDILEKYSATNPYTRIYSIGKTLLAVSLLCTLAFNDIPTLFVEQLYKKGNLDFINSHYNLFYLFDYSSLWIPKTIAIVILLFTISGYLPQMSGFLHWWVCFSFFSSAIIVDGGDQINANVTLLLIPITLLDNRMNSWTNSYNTNSVKNLLAWMFFFFIEMQGAFLYLQSSVEKPYKIEEWRNGTAIYYWFNNNIFGTSKFLLSFVNPILTNSYLAFIVTWGAILLELSLFGAFFMRPKRRTRLFILAVLFHFLILLFQGLASFFFSISGLLVLYLLNRYYAFKITNAARQFN